MSVDAVLPSRRLPFSGHSPVTVLAMAILAITLFVSMAGPLLTTQDPNIYSADLNMPPSVNAQFQGSAASFEASLANEPILILAALIVV